MIIINRLVMHTQSIKIVDWQTWVISGASSVGIALLVTILTSCVFYKQDFRNALNIVKKMLKR